MRYSWCSEGGFVPSLHKICAFFRGRFVTILIKNDSNCLFLDSFFKNGYYLIICWYSLIKYIILWFFLKKIGVSDYFYWFLILPYILMPCDSLLLNIMIKKQGIFSCFSPVFPSRCIFLTLWIIIQKSYFLSVLPYREQLYCMGILGVPFA